MSTQHEGPTQPGDSGEIPGTESQATVYELHRAVQGLRGHAQALGMLDQKLFFSLDMRDDGGQLRIWGQPLRPAPADGTDPYLWLVINRTYMRRPKTHERTRVFSEEYIIGPTSLTRDGGYLTVAKRDRLRHDPQPAVIWATKGGGWAVFRGTQESYLPELPQPDTVPEDLIDQLAEAKDLETLLGGLTPGCEDARYLL